MSGVEKWGEHSELHQESREQKQEKALFMANAFVRLIFL